MGVRRERLSHLFTGVVAKRLAAVEAEPVTSNQHEFNGTTALKRLLGDERLDRMPARFIWLGGENEGMSAEGFLTWYDARERHPTRSEWRLYFFSNDVMDMASESDLLLIARRPDGFLLIIVAPAESSIERGLLWLFGVGNDVGQRFLFEDIEGGDRELDFAARFILDELGIETEEPVENRIDELVAGIVGDGHFEFPTTRFVSDLARSNAEAPDPRDDPDSALLAWLEFEEALFRRLERACLGTRIRAGFLQDGEPDVDGFVSTALSVLNRRKSRMGLSLENHVEAAVQAWGLRYERGALTEGKSKPDFLFPGSTEYHDQAFDAGLLAMLGVKSTLKDRWRQVLAEAARIDEKHLLTLQPGISDSQMSEMQRHRLRLVVPVALHCAYGSAAKEWLMPFREFLDLVRHRQAP